MTREEILKQASELNRDDLCQLIYELQELAGIYSYITVDALELHEEHCEENEVATPYDKFKSIIKKHWYDWDSSDEYSAITSSIQEITG